MRTTSCSAVAPADAGTRLDEAMRLAIAQPVALPKTSAELDPQHLGSALKEAEEQLAASQAALSDERSKNEALPEELAGRAETSLLLQAQTFFAASGRFVVISSWVPQESAGRLNARRRTPSRRPFHRGRAPHGRATNSCDAPSCTPAGP